MYIFNKVNILFLNLCFLILFVNQVKSQNIVSNGVLNKYYLLYSFNDSRNYKGEDKGDLLQWLINNDSIIFKDIVSNHGKASLMFLGNNNVQLSYVLRNYFSEIDETSKDSIFITSAEDVLMGKWIIIDDKVYISFVFENKEFQFNLFRQDNLFIMKKVKNIVFFRNGNE